MWRVLKKILIVILVIAGIFVIWAIIDSGYQAWQGYKWNKQTEKFQAALEQPYKEDIYGGKTPEETWSMFLDALKKGDVELASKYYDVAHQVKAKQMIEKLQQESKFNWWLKNLQNLEKDENQGIIKDYIYYSYKYFDNDTQQDLWASVVFYQNPYTKVWKIVY